MFYDIYYNQSFTNGPGFYSNLDCISNPDTTSDLSFIGDHDSAGNLDLAGFSSFVSSYASIIGYGLDYNIGSCDGYDSNSSIKLLIIIFLYIYLFFFLL